MIVDSSALLAVLYREPDAEHYETAIAATPDCRMSVANVLEASIILEGRGGTAAGHELDVFLKDAAIELVPVTVAHMEAARRALAPLRQGESPGGAELRRLLRLCARRRDG